MASKVPGVSCSLCGEGGHRPSNCWKELGVPPDGFFSGGGAHRDHGGDEDEHLRALPLEPLTVKTIAHESAHRMMEFNPRCESGRWRFSILPTDLPMWW